MSIVIPTLNEEHHLGSLLSDISCQTRWADEVIVVDAGSEDGTVSTVMRFPDVVFLACSSPVGAGRTLGGQSAHSDVLTFLDADVRIPRGFFEGFLEEFEERRLDIACPLYVPHESTWSIRSVFAFFNLLFRVFEKLIPSGAGHCIAVRGKVFRRCRGFDPTLKFDDIELIRHLSKGHRSGILSERIYVSDRRYREQGVFRMVSRYLLMSLFFALRRYRWANMIDYEFGNHKR